MEDKTTRIKAKPKDHNPSSLLKIPRIMIAGTGSGCGKTTVSCAVMKAFAKRKLRISPFKCGPDYIDPMFHAHILGRPSTNLDAFFFNENTLKALLAKNAAEDVNIIEGVMGFYDGLGIDSAAASSYEIARVTQTPVILVMNAKGSAFSLLAQIRGFLDFLPENQICGVILNRCSGMTYPKLAHAVRQHFGEKVSPMGFLPELPDCTLESRHLGLVTAQEIDGLDDKLERLALQAEKTLELDLILRSARNAGTLSWEKLPIQHFPEKIRIGVAEDRAFCFYYHDNLDLLREMGAEVLPFSPLSDKDLPEKIHGIYIGGGYPELYAETLSENKAMRSAVRIALSEGMPCIAECGGFMYLTNTIGGYPMAGVLPGSCYNTGKLTRFGYVTLTAKQDSMLCEKGTKIAAHEFHYWDCEKPGDGFTAEKCSGKQWECIYTNSRLYAGFPHFHFFANPESAVRFYSACLRYKEEQHA